MVLENPWLLLVLLIQLVQLVQAVHPLQVFLMALFLLNNQDILSIRLVLIVQ